MVLYLHYQPENCFGKTRVCWLCHKCFFLWETQNDKKNRIWKFKNLKNDLFVALLFLKIFFFCFEWGFFFYLHYQLKKFFWLDKSMFPLWKKILFWWETQNVKNKCIWKFTNLKNDHILALFFLKKFVFFCFGWGFFSIYTIKLKSFFSKTRVCLLCEKQFFFDGKPKMTKKSYLKI